MYVKQISVFLENHKGTLAKITQLLGENGIDLIALSIADTEQYGILRCIVPNAQKATQVLRDAGYSVRETQVLAVCVEDEPGGLGNILNALMAADISVEYLYSFVRSTGKYAMVIFHLDNIAAGESVLREKGVKLLDLEQIRQL
ncbi:ACT domain-containing protein [Eubacteriales bacterium OttesenSCG-928-N13]|nr:ACT domain-containing protein [Eubacteriales bacterium OttesenSCG-928-N13]